MTPGRMNKSLAEPDRPTLVIAPHFDDAVLSAWAVLDSETERPADVMTVFGGQPTSAVTTAADTDCGFANSSEAMRVRRSEDEAALRDVAGRRWHLELVEMQYGALADRPHARDELRAAVEEWLAERGREGEPAVVVAPSGAGRQMAAGLSAPSADGSRGRGGPWLAWLRAVKHRVYMYRKHKAQRGGALAHPDHLFVRDVVMSLAAEHAGMTVLLYEDLPYLWSGGPDEYIAGLAASGDWTVTELSMPVDRARKAQSLAHYASQLPALDPEGRRLEAPETLPPVERYWRVSRVTHP